MRIKRAKRLHITIQDHVTIAGDEIFPLQTFHLPLPIVTIATINANDCLALIAITLIIIWQRLTSR